MNDRLKGIIEQANARFMLNVSRMEKKFGWSAIRPINELETFLWLSQAKHEISNRFSELRGGSGGCYALAYSKRQLIRYNPSFLETRGEHYDHDVLDMVLHELGHLWTWKFLGTRGHDHTWQSLGLIVGYVPVGSTRIEWRRAAANDELLSYRIAAMGGVHHPLLGV